MQTTLHGRKLKTTIFVDCVSDHEEELGDRGGRDGDVVGLEARGCKEIALDRLFSRKSMGHADASGGGAVFGSLETRSRNLRGGNGGGMVISQLRQQKTVEEMEAV